MSEISELEQDALKEFFNMGLGVAADSLSQMVHNEVLLSLPQLAVVSRLEAVKLVQGDTDEQMVAIRQKFGGGLNGTALLIFPGAKSLALVRTLLGDDVPLESLTQLEQETLLDVGNVILNAFLGSFTEMMTVDLEFAPAEFLRAACSSLLDISSHLTTPQERRNYDPLEQDNEKAFFLMMDFKTGEESLDSAALQGFVVILFTPEDMIRLREILKQVLADY